MKKLISILIVLLFTNCSKEKVDPPSDSNDDDDKVVVVQISASDDYVNTSEDTAVSSGNVMNNDTFPEGTRISSYDETSLNGAEIIDNRDGSFKYTPENSFTGEDSFSYTICDTEKMQTVPPLMFMYLLKTRAALRLLMTTSMLCLIRP